MKSRVLAYDLSTLLAAALGRLEGRAWNSAQVASIVQLEADPGSTMTYLSIAGACCTLPCAPASLFT